MPQFFSYPQVTVAAPEDTFLINQAIGGVKQLAFQDLQASLSLPSISGTLPINKGGTGSVLTSPGQDSILFWDNSAAATKFLSIGTGLQIVGTVLNCTVTGGGGGSGGAPVGATYWTSLPNGDLTNEFAFSTLTTGLIKNTTTTGVPSIAIPGEDYAMGAGASTDNAIVRFNGTPGGLIQDSNVTLADSGVTLQFSGEAGLSAGGSNHNVTLNPTGTGVVLLGTAIQTSPSSGGTGAKWKLGQVKSASVTADTTSYLEVSVDGAIYKLIKAV